MRQDTIADRETERHAVAWMHTIRRNPFVVNPGVDQAMVDALEQRWLRHRNMNKAIAIHHGEFTHHAVG